MTYAEITKQIQAIAEKDLMTGKCKRCKEVNKLYVRTDGNYCYDCKRVTPIRSVGVPRILDDKGDNTVTNKPKKRKVVL